MGFINPAVGVTIPWRSWSASLAKATSKRSRMATSGAMAYGDEQSVRILPSQSTVMKRNVGSTTSFTTVNAIPYRAMIGPQ